jgi:hypothetical protein
VDADEVEPEAYSATALAMFLTCSYPWVNGTPMSQGKCYGLSRDGEACLNTALCKAHVLPRGFARRIMGANKTNKLLTLSAVTNTQHGVYDQEILCKDCDRWLGGAYDKYAVEILWNIRDKVVPLPNDLGLGDLVRIENVDGDRLALFVLSVLWRASISRRFPKVDLEHSTLPAAQALFGVCHLEATLSNFQVYIERLQTKLPLSPGGFWTAPARVYERNGWAFALGGFRFTAKFDARSFLDEHKPFIINGSRNLLCRVVRFEDGPEHAALRDIAAAQLRRKSKPRSVLKD